MLSLIGHRHDQTLIKEPWANATAWHIGESMQNDVCTQPDSDTWASRRRRSFEPAFGSLQRLILLTGGAR